MSGGAAELPEDDRPLMELNKKQLQALKDFDKVESPVERATLRVVGLTFDVLKAQLPDSTLNLADVQAEMERALGTFGDIRPDIQKAICLLSKALLLLYGEEDQSGDAQLTVAEINDLAQPAYKEEREDVIYDEVNADARTWTLLCRACKVLDAIAADGDKWDVNGEIIRLDEWLDKMKGESEPRQLDNALFAVCDEIVLRAQAYEGPPLNLPPLPETPHASPADPPPEAVPTPPLEEQAELEPRPEASGGATPPPDVPAVLIPSPTATTARAPPPVVLNPTRHASVGVKVEPQENEQQQHQLPLQRQVDETAMGNGATAQQGPLEQVRRDASVDQVRLRLKRVAVTVPPASIKRRPGDTAPPPGIRPHQMSPLPQPIDRPAPPVLPALARIKVEVGEQPEEQQPAPAARQAIVQQNPREQQPPARRAMTDEELLDENRRIHTMIQSHGARRARVTEDPDWSLVGGQSSRPFMRCNICQRAGDRVRFHGCPEIMAHVGRNHRIARPSYMFCVEDPVLGVVRL